MKTSAFCITESGGAHPKAIRSALKRNPDKTKKSSPWIVNGRKSFITAATEAELFLIAVSSGKDETGRPRLRIIEVDRKTAGLEIEPQTPLPFIPEITHGALTLTAVPIQDTMLLPGDGYRHYIKPFRTIEDVHVSAAITGYFFRIACRYGWPRQFQEQLLNAANGIKALSLKDPRRRDVHIVLGGWLSQWEDLVHSVEDCWNRVDADTRRRWQRDRVLLDLAREARSKRLASAWLSYGSARV